MKKHRKRKKYKNVVGQKGHGESSPSIELQELMQNKTELVQPRDLADIKKKLKRKVTVCLDEVDFTVKEHELYKGLEHFSLRCRLVTLRSGLQYDFVDDAPPRRRSRIIRPSADGMAPERSTIQLPHYNHPDTRQEKSHIPSPFHSNAHADAPSAY